MNGFILLSRGMLESDLMDAPPLWTKLWLWMLLRAEWRQGKKLKRGQLLTTISAMQEAMAYKVGYRKEQPSRDQIRSAYEAFTKATMITTTKTIRGMIITILNYEKYQDFKTYEPHNESHNEDTTKPTMTPHDSLNSEEVNTKNPPNPPEGDLPDGGDANGNGNPEPPKPDPKPKKNREPKKPVPYSESFLAFWELYPRKTAKGYAFECWQKVGKLELTTVPMIMAALQNQLDAGAFNLSDPDKIPHPSTWLNQRRWEDELTTPAGQSPDEESTPTLTDEEVQEMLRRQAEQKAREAA